MLKIGYKVFTHAWLMLGIKYTMVGLLHEFQYKLLLDSTTLNPPGQPCFLRTFMKSWFAQRSSGGWVTPLPGKTFLHINRASPTEKIAFVQRMQVLHSKLSKINIISQILFDFYLFHTRISKYTSSFMKFLLHPC